MGRRTLLVRILLPFLGVIALALAAATWEASTSMRQFHRKETAATLETRARLFALQLAGKIRKEDAPVVDGICKDLRKLSGTRITVILPSGQVIGDSEEDPGRMDNHGDRPEVKEALNDRVGQAMRYSYTLRTNYLYVAIPVIEDDRLVGVVRASRSFASVERAMGNVYARIILTTAVVALVSALISLGLARHIARPLREMMAGVQQYAEGRFEHRLALPNTTELAELAAAMNVMAAQLRERVRTVDRQRSELDAVLSSMAEGVLAVDDKECVISLNRAAADLFGAHMDVARGRDIREIVRNPKIHECVRRMLAEGEPFEENVVLGGAEERHLRVSVTGLRGEQGRRIGVLLVLQDITQLHRLERARSDFVANVSHEIRTPITSIKGYAETLVNEPQDDPERVRHFIEVIARQADRLAALVDDILSLAALERSETAQDAVLEPMTLRPVIEASIQTCTPKAASKNVRLVAACDEDIEVVAHAALLEEAIVNLIDNAAKYSRPDGEVRIEAARSAGTIEIRVRDSGAGIASEHLPRIFERFYRVDRARSRKLGGTGLGLAIVKHIVALHHGSVTVESVLGKGSCFTIHLPLAK